MVNIGETELKSYGELYKAIVESIGKDEADFIIGPLLDAAVEIEHNRRAIIGDAIAAKEK